MPSRCAHTSDLLAVTGRLSSGCNPCCSKQTKSGQHPPSMWSLHDQRQLKDAPCALPISCRLVVFHVESHVSIAPEQIKVVRNHISDQDEQDLSADWGPARTKCPSHAYANPRCPTLAVARVQVRNAYVTKSCPH